MAFWRHVVAIVGLVCLALAPNECFALVGEDPSAAGAPPGVSARERMIEALSLAIVTQPAGIEPRTFQVAEQAEEILQRPGIKSEICARRGPGHTLESMVTGLGL